MSNNIIDFEKKLLESKKHTKAKPSHDGGLKDILRTPELELLEEACEKLITNLNSSFMDYDKDVAPYLTSKGINPDSCTLQDVLELAGLDQLSDPSLSDSEKNKILKNIFKESMKEVIDTNSVSADTLFKLRQVVYLLQNSVDSVEKAGELFSSMAILGGAHLLEERGLLTQGELSLLYLCAMCGDDDV